MLAKGGFWRAALAWGPPRTTHDVNGGVTRRVWARCVGLWDISPFAPFLSQAAKGSPPRPNQQGPIPPHTHPPTPTPTHPYTTPPTTPQRQPHNHASPRLLPHPPFVCWSVIAPPDLPSGVYFPAPAGHMFHTIPQHVPHGQFCCEKPAPKVDWGLCQPRTTIFTFSTSLTRPPPPKEKQKTEHGKWRP